jgi:hypothetical protein
MLSTVVHLANKPDGAVFACLLIGLVLFIIAGVLAFMEKAFWAVLISAGLVLFVLSFLIT